MPTFSLIVAAYNRGPYMEQCLDSLVGQTYKDIEIIVVDDASTDGTLDVIRSYAHDDERIHVIAKQHNEGAHLARKDGCAASTGDYVIFVDGDDALEITTCELMAPYAVSHDVDIVRFGRIVTGLTERDQAFATSLEYMYNRQSDELFDRQISMAMFSDQPQRLTYCVIDSVFKGDVIRNAFDQMPRERLGRLEDAYESFVIADVAKSLLALPECRFLHYHFGRGVSGMSQLTADSFDKDQKEIYGIVKSVYQYAQTRSDFIQQRANWFKTDALRIVGNQWEERVAGDEHESALQCIEDTWGTVDACSIALSPLLGRAQELCRLGLIPKPDDSYYHWRHMVSNVESVRNNEAVSARFAELEAFDSTIESYREHMENQRRLASEAAAEAVERRRLLKTGSAAKRIVDSILPESSRLRQAIRGFLTPFRL